MERRPVLVAAAASAVLLLLSPAFERAGRAGEEQAAEDAVILEESMEIDIASSSEARLRHRMRVQILTPAGAENLDEAPVSYNPWVSIRELRGAVLSPSGKRVELKKQNIYDTGNTYELYAEDKERVLRFPGVVPGSTIEYEYEQSLRSLFFLPRSFSLQGSIPVRLKTLTVRVPTSFAIRFSVHGEAPEPSRTETGDIVTHRWEVRDVPALKTERGMPPEIDVLPRIEIAPKEIVFGEHRIDSSTWDGIAGWDWKLVRDRIGPTPEVEQTARELTAGLQDPDAKIQRLYEFVQRKIDYVQIYLGIGGWQPHSSGDVLRHRYGDCKDKATLLIALLLSVGVRSYPVLIMTRNVKLIDRDSPSPSFNHQIVAVPRDGEFLFLDATPEDTPYGDLPWMDQGVPALVVKEDGRGELVTTPLFPPERNRRHIQVVAHLKPTGDLEGRCEIQAWGVRRELLSDLVAAKPSEREDALADLMSLLCPGAVLQSQEVKVSTDPQAPAAATLRFTVPRFTMRAGTKEVVSPYLVRFNSLTDVASYPKRRHPVLLKDLRSDTTEIRLHFPPGRTVKKIPADRSLNSPGLSASTHFELVKEQDHQVLTVRRSITVSRREIPVEDYPALRSFVSSLAEEEANALTLELDAIATALPRPSGR
jgi:hypothetical protein